MVETDEKMETDENKLKETICKLSQQLTTKETIKLQTEYQGDLAIKGFKASLQKCVPLPSYEKLTPCVDLILKSTKLKSMVLRGEAGIGKSSWLLDKLKTRCEFAYLNNYVSPLSLYKFCYQHRNTQAIIFDDVDALLENPNCVSILKALTDTKDENLVTYNSTSSKLDVPSAFIFKGKIFILTNDLPSVHKLRSVLDRAIVRDISLSTDEKKEFASAVLKSNYTNLTDIQTKEITDFINEHLNEKVIFSFRTIIRIAEYYLNQNKVWKDLAIEELKPNPELILIKQLQKEFPNSVNTQAIEFTKRTGNCRDTFYRRKKLLESNENLKI